VGLLVGVSLVGRFGGVAVSLVGRFGGVAVSFVGRFGGIEVSLVGDLAAIGVAVPSPAFGPVVVALAVLGAGARVIGFVGARPVAGFAPGSCRMGDFGSATTVRDVGLGIGDRFASLVAPPFARSDATTIACGDSSPHTPQNRDSAGTGVPHPRHGASASGACAAARRRTPHLAQKLSSG
jgi:hypothetical protein